MVIVGILVQIVLAASFNFCLIVSPSQGEVRYTIKDMGTIDSRSWTRPEDINNKEVVVGSYSYGGGGRASGAFIWTATEGFRKIDVPIGQGSTRTGYQINDAGQIVCQSRIKSGTGEGTGIHGFLWDSTMGVLDLGRTSGWGFAINNQGQVVGGRPPHNSSDHKENLVFIWDATTRHSVVELEEGFSRRAFDINDSGEILGGLQTDEGTEKFFFWSPTKGMEILDDPGVESITNSQNRLNNQGQILISVKIEKGEYHPYLSIDGRLTQMPSLSGGGCSARDMNNLGQIVGSSYPLGESLMRDVKDKIRMSLFDSRSRIGRKFKMSLRRQLSDTGWSHATLWENGEIFDLNDLIPEDSPYFLHVAFAINDRELIVCGGRLKGRRGRGRSLSLLLIPVHE